VERPAPDSAYRIGWLFVSRFGLLGMLLPSDCFDPMQQILGCSAGECQKKDSFRRSAVVNEAGNAMRERHCLSGTGSGDDEQRRISVPYGLFLGCV
jgi:hypothetical protein